MHRLHHVNPGFCGPIPSKLLGKNCSSMITSFANIGHYITATPHSFWAKTNAINCLLAKIFSMYHASNKKTVIKARRGNLLATSIQIERVLLQQMSQFQKTKTEFSSDEEHVEGETFENFKSLSAS